MVHFWAALENLPEAGIADTSEFMPHKKREPKVGQGALLGQNGDDTPSGQGGNDVPCGAIGNDTFPS